MKIRNKLLLDRFKGPGLCEVCGKLCRNREPMHLISRGAGGPDIAMNLLAAGSTPLWECTCHSANHQKTDGRIVTKEQLVEIVAKREQVRPEDVLTIINWFMLLPKGLTRAQIEERCVYTEFGFALAWKAARRTIDELQLKD